MRIFHEYNPDAWSNRSYRFGKYLVPVASFLPSLRRQAAPRHRTSLSELALSAPQAVSVHKLEDEPPLPVFPIDVVSRRGVASTPGGGQPPRTMNAYRLAGTASFGRGGILIAPGGRVIRESESNRDDSGRSFLRLNPNYWKRRYVSDLTCRWKLPAPSKLHGRAAILNNYVANNFYHWMLEVGPKLTALDLVGIEVDHYVLDCQLPYQRRILQLLGVDLTRVIQPHCQSHLLADEIVWFNMPTTGVVQQYASAILKQLANNTPRESSRNRIYISRRDAVHRRLQNEREVERELGKLGVTSVCMSDLSIDEQIELFRDASLIVTIHGAALANLIFANPHLKIVEIVPESRMNRSLFPEWSRQLGLDHLLVYCQTSRFRQRLQVCVDDLLAAVEAHDACDARIRP